MKKVLLSILLLSFVTSCMTTKTPVGQYREAEGKEETYSKARQLFLFWGLVPLGRAEAATPADGTCLVVTKYNFGDFLVSTLTGGIVMTYSIKVKVKKPVAEKQKKSKE